MNGGWCWKTMVGWCAHGREPVARSCHQLVHSGIHRCETFECDLNVEWLTWWGSFVGFETMTETPVGVSVGKDRCHDSVRGISLEQGGEDPLLEQAGVAVDEVPRLDDVNSHR
jgi:hypothetical protein